MCHIYILISILILENSHFNLCIMINNFKCLFNFWLMMNIFFMLFKAYSSGIRVLAIVTNIFFQIFMNNFYMILKIVWSGKWFITPITFMNFFFLMNIFNNSSFSKLCNATLHWEFIRNFFWKFLNFSTTWMHP